MAPGALVAGGGLAGCAAALKLASSGWRVTLLEKTPALGGKVSSFRWPGLSGALADNGQHVLTKSCTALKAFLEEIGASGRIRWQDRLRIPFALPGGRLEILERWDLPAPAHLLPGLLTLDLLPLSERWALRRVLKEAGGRVPEDRTFRDWLESLDQGPAAIRRFWEPLCLAVCNASPVQTSAAMGAWVVREGLCASRDALDLGVATVPQSGLIGPGVRARLEALGGEVRTGAVVEASIPGGLVLRGGEVLRADGVILALPWDAAAALLPGRLGALSGLRPGCILSVALRLDRAVLPEGEDFVALVDQPFQWAFSKTRLWGLDPADGEVLSLVLSGAGGEADLDGAALADLALRSLQACLPRAIPAKVLDSVAMRERRATFLPAPGSARLRPGPSGAGLKNLALAGSWTDTGWPATMEGAVRSGRAAAEALLAGAGA